jgi:MraZ protein
MLGVQGQHTSVFDDRGRIALGSRLGKALKQLATDGEKPTIVVTYWDGGLQGYTQKQWRKLEQKVALQPRFSRSARSFALVFLGIAAEVQVDRQGRVLIPQHLREKAGLDEKAVVLSYMDTLEIWDPERLKRRQQAEAENLDVGDFVDDLVFPMEDGD